jgi:hypothetical protein
MIRAGNTEITKRARIITLFFKTNIYIYIIRPIDV